MYFPTSFFSFNKKIKGMDGAKSVEILKITYTNHSLTNNDLGNFKNLYQKNWDQKHYYKIITMVEDDAEKGKISKYWPPKERLSH